MAEHKDDIEVEKNHSEDQTDKPENKSHHKNIFFQKLKEYIKTPKGKVVLILVILLVAFLVGIGITAYNRYFAPEKQKTTASKTPLPSVTNTAKKAEEKVLCNLDGVMYSKDVANRHPLAVMVENHPDARPQSGLSKAKLVYEAVTEGGITRFMAVFGPESASKVGPTRSARTYFLDWALEYDAFYAHVGGNIDALDLIPELGVKDLDQFRYGSEAYWRVPEAGKATEHTMFTDTDKLWNIAKDNGWNMSSSFDALKFKQDAVLAQRPESEELSLDFSSSAQYQVTWKYNKNDNVYERYLAGVPHKDAETNEILKAKNVVVQEVDRWYAPTRINEAGWAMKTVGEGNAKVFIDGKMIEGKWKKENHTARTKFYDPTGKEIEFDPGITWYEIIPTGSNVSVK